MAEPLSEAKAKASAGKTLKQDAKRAEEFAAEITAKRLKKILTRAQADLKERLKKVEAAGQGDSFTAVQMQMALKQIQEVIRPLKKGMAGLIVDSAKKGAKAHATKILNYIEEAEQKFAGIARPLAIRQARVFERAVNGTETSVLRRIMTDPTQKGQQGILDRYGANVVQKFENELQLGLITRASWEEMRGKLVEQSPFLQQSPRWWAERVIRTELMYAQNRSGFETLRAVDEELGDLCKILMATFDNRTACLLGTTPATSGVIRAIFRRWYEGAVLEVVTEAGRYFAATPNHPVLTRRGWVRTDGLCSNDELICDAWQQRFGTPRNDDEAHRPTAIGEVFDSLAGFGRCERRRGRQEDFHGDGRDGHVDVFRPDHELRLGRFAAISKPLAQGVFSPTDAVDFCRECGCLLGPGAREQAHSLRAGSNSYPGIEETSGDKRLRGFQTLADAFDRFAEHVPPHNLFDGHASAEAGMVGRVRKAQLEGLRLRPAYPRGLQQLVDIPTMGVESCRYLGARHAAPIELDDVLGVQALCSLVDASEPLGSSLRSHRAACNQCVAEGKYPYGGHGGEHLLYGFAARIEVDRVVEIRRRNFCGHVFNLTTAEGYYSANGVLTGNCDSYSYHGQIRRTNEAFDTWTGSMQHPPGRPNDREVVVPHRVSWPIPDELLPKSDAEVAERWIYEGRKGSPPPRPKLTTIPLEKFGVTPPPPIELEPELPPPAPEEAPLEVQQQPLVPEGEQLALPMPEAPPPEPVDPVFAAAQAELAGWKQWISSSGIVQEGWSLLPDELSKATGVSAGAPGEPIQDDEGITLHQFYKEAMKVDQEGKASSTGPMKDKYGWTKISDLVFTDPAVYTANVLEAVKHALPEVKGMPIVIIQGGKPHLLKGAESAIAKKLKGESDLFGLVLDHDAWLAKKKAEADDAKAKTAAEAEAKKKTEAEAAQKEADALAVTTAAAEVGPTVQLDAEAILTEKVGEAAGSNKGGFYLGKDGVRRYVKFYDDPTQAVCEHIANQIYRDLGIGAPRSQVFEHDGKLAYASEVLDGETLAKTGVTKENARAFMHGFAADVLTGNWDAAGMTHDNAFVLPDGRVIRIDSGGTFLFRAKAGRKPASVLEQITEMQKFFDSGTNHAYAQIAQKAGYPNARKMREVLAAQIERIVKMRDEVGGWRRYIEDRADPESFNKRSDADEMINMLEARTKQMADFVEQLKRTGPTTAAAEPDRPVELGANYDVDHPVGKQLQSLARQSADDPGGFVKNQINKKAGVKVEQFNAVQSLVSSWTGGYRDSPTHRAVYRATQKFIETEAPETDLERAVHAAAATREKRWKVIAKLAGAEEAPSYFDLRRGMHGEEHVVAVANAWADGKETHATIPTEAVASWTFSEEVGTRYAGREAGVVFRWKHCPMHNTFFDQIADDGKFVTSYGPKQSDEAEVIAGPGHNRGLNLPKHDQVVRYRGKTYTYDDRDELLEILRDEGKI